MTSLSCLGRLANAWANHREWSRHPQITELANCDFFGMCAGSTAYAIHELEKAGVRSAFINAVLAAADRSAQLAKL